LQEYFFERTPEVFSSILGFFSTGHLHIPRTLCVELFVDECNYWGICFTPYDCCQGYHQSQFELIETVRKANQIFLRRTTFVADDSEDDSEQEMSPIEEIPQEKERPSYQRWKKLKRRTWDLFEDPSSSRAAKILNAFSTLMVLLSTIVLCLNTHPEIAHIRDDGTKADNPHLKIVETVCIVWFTFEYACRYCVSPSKREFLKSVMNGIDFLAILPFYVGAIIEVGYGDGAVGQMQSFTDARRFMQTLRIFRIIRIFKVARHSAGLQVLGYTVRNSGPELSLLGILLLMGMTLFATLVYYAEEDVPNTKFSSIIASFWWAIITMTTVGYGDMAPVSSGGQVVGALCCVSGILFIALPIPTIVTNFSSFYKDHRNKKRVEALYGDDANTGELNVLSFISSDHQSAKLDRVENVTSSWKSYRRRLSNMSQIDGLRKIRSAGQSTLHTSIHPTTEFERVDE